MTSTDPTLSDSAEGHYAVTEANLLQATERKRLRALVAADIETADLLHANDFQLINPGGGALSKEEYLGEIASGNIHYHLWEPGSIAVRVQGQMAILRYQSQIEISVDGQTAPLRRYWPTDSYEKTDGRWQIV